MGQKTYYIPSTPVSNKFYLLLDLNQWLPPYESNTLTTELSRSFIILKRTKWNPSRRWIINIIFFISNNNRTNTTQKFRMLNHRIFILTTNYIHDKICITSTKGYSSVGRAPRLHARQCFFRGIHHPTPKMDLISKSTSYSIITLREQ